MRLLGSEIRASSTGHRLRVEFIWADGLLLRAYPATEHGYGFKGRQPGRFVAMWRPGESFPVLDGLSYAHGGFPRPGMLQAFRAELLLQLEAALEGHPEMQSMPCALLRCLATGSCRGQEVEETRLGAVIVEHLGGVVHMESEGLLAPMLGRRYILARHDAGATTMLCWTMDVEGVRRKVEPTRLEKDVVDAIVSGRLDRSQVDEYSGLRRMDAPSGVLEPYGVASLHDLVLRLNDARRKVGRAPLPHGSYPTSMVRLRSFMRLVAHELPF